MNLKKIHRIYFGFDGKPDPYEEYLQNWKKTLPSYEILHWNSSNLPMDICDYTKRLHELQDHAFLSDYFRWYLLSEYGGIYLDADIEIVNPELFNQVVEDLEGNPELESFIGIDERQGGWFTAHSMGSKPGSDLSIFMREAYESMDKLYLWRRKDFYFMAPQMTGLYFTARGFNVDGMGSLPTLEQPVVREKTKIYPQDWFSPVTPTFENGVGGFALTGYTKNTCLCHHFSGSWHTPDSPYSASIAARGGRNLMLQDYQAQGRSPNGRIKSRFRKLIVIWKRRREIISKVREI
jgi:hypothetical protein